MTDCGLRTCEYVITFSENFVFWFLARNLCTSGADGPLTLFSFLVWTGDEASSASILRRHIMVLVWFKDNEFPTKLA